MSPAQYEGPSLAKVAKTHHDDFYPIAGLLDELCISDQAERGEIETFLMEYLTHKGIGGPVYSKEIVAAIPDSKMLQYAEGFLDRVVVRNLDESDPFDTIAGQYYFPPPNLGQNYRRSPHEKKYNYVQHRHSIILLVSEILKSQREAQSAEIRSTPTEGEPKRRQELPDRGSKSTEKVRNNRKKPTPARRQAQHDDADFRANSNLELEDIEHPMARRSHHTQKRARTCSSFESSTSIGVHASPRRMASPEISPALSTSVVTPENSLISSAVDNSITVPGSSNVEKSIATPLTHSQPENVPNVDATEQDSTHNPINTGVGSGNENDFQQVETDTKIIRLRAKIEGMEVTISYCEKEHFLLKKVARVNIANEAARRDALARARVLLEARELLRSACEETRKELDSLSSTAINGKAYDDEEENGAAAAAAAITGLRRAAKAEGFSIAHKYFMDLYFERELAEQRSAAQGERECAEVKADTVLQVIVGMEEALEDVKAGPSATM